jgi:hypothetical protein
MIAETSTGPAAKAAPGAEAGADWAAGAAVAALAAAGAAEASDEEWPNMADIMLPKILIAVLPEFERPLRATSIRSSALVSTAASPASREKNAEDTARA